MSVENADRKSVAASPGDTPSTGGDSGSDASGPLPARPAGDSSAPGSSVTPSGSDSLSAARARLRAIRERATARNSGTTEKAGGDSIEHKSDVPEINGAGSASAI